MTLGDLARNIQEEDPTSVSSVQVVAADGSPVPDSTSAAVLTESRGVGVSFRINQTDFSVNPPPILGEYVFFGFYNLLFGEV